MICQLKGQREFLLGGDPEDRRFARFDPSNKHRSRRTTMDPPAPAQLNLKSLLPTAADLGQLSGRSTREQKYGNVHNSRLSSIQNL